jgi:hypothetical protein
MSITIERAHREDLADVLGLLERHGLPVDGASRMDDALVVACSDGRIVGAAGRPVSVARAVVPSFGRSRRCPSL